MNDLSRDVWMFVVSVAVAVSLAIGMRANHQAGELAEAAQRQARSAAVEARRSQAAAHESCVRVRRFSPKLAVAYRRFHILTEAELRAYVDTIPKTCPPR